MTDIVNSHVRAAYGNNSGYFERKHVRQKVERAYKHILSLKSNVDKLKYICKKFGKAYPAVLNTKRFSDLRKWIDDLTPLLDNTFFKLSTKIFWILNDWTKFPVCLNESCLNEVRRNVSDVFGHYPLFCCLACINLSLLHIKKCEKTIKKHGGHKAIILKSFLTYKNKTGYANPALNPKVKAQASETYKRRTGYEHNFLNPAVLARRKNTWKKNYGADHPMRSKKVKAKLAKTNLERYGLKCFFLTDRYNKFARKTYSYDGYTFASMPELCYYIWLKDHDVDFEFQPKTKFTYKFNGKTHKYTPDFYLKKKRKYVDIKGNYFFEDHDPTKKMVNPYDSSEDALYEAKHQCMLKNKVLILCDYQFAINYVHEKYGKNYLESFRRSTI